MDQLNQKSETTSHWKFVKHISTYVLCNFVFAIIHYDKLFKFKPISHDELEIILEINLPRSVDYFYKYQISVNFYSKLISNKFKTIVKK